MSGVAALLGAAAARAGDRVALVDEDSASPRRWTWSGLDEAARRVAEQLGERGVAPGDRVALLCGNGAPFVAAWFGIAYAGATVVPIPTVSALPEVRHRLVHAACRMAIVDRERQELAQSAGAPAVALADELLIGQVGQRRLPEIADDAVAMILYTSGTTGTPKAAMFSHGSLVTHTRNLAATLGLDGDDVILGALPLTHSFGCRMVMLLATVLTARVVLMRRFSAARALELVDGAGVTWLPAVPTMLAGLVARSVGAQHPSPSRRLRWCLSAGAPLPDALARRAEMQLGCDVRQGYGLTEASFSTVDAPPAPRTLGSVGRAVAGVELRLGDAGEVLMRGPHRTLGYLDDAAATAAALDGDWLHTGDVGRLDDAGRLWIVDRTKDLIIRGGNNVYPSEVESVLAQHPGVSQVAVVGRPDDYFGEEIVAVIVPRDVPPPATELLTLLRAHLGATKLPRELVFVAEMPLGASGKVLKRILREQLVDGTLRPEKLKLLG
jgi:long-chain acyl-CoA synthetase